MTSQQPHQQEYICNDDDLGCLHDYMMAAIAGYDISELPRLWNQEIGVIKSRPHTIHSSATEPADEKFMLSLHALVGIHRELTNIEGMTSHISDLLTPIQTSVLEHDTSIAQAERENVLDEIREWTRGNSETIEAYDGTLEDAIFLGDLLAKLESLRSGGK